MRGRKRIAVEKRFWTKVKKTEGDGCWLWTGCVNSKGHGIFYTPEDVVTAHRKSYELEIGKIPPGLCVQRRCGVPACVNPSHLFLGCGPGNKKLALSDVENIRASNARGAVLAKLYGVSPTHITQIRFGKKWSNNWVVP